MSTDVFGQTGAATFGPLRTVGRHMIAVSAALLLSVGCGAGHPAAWNRQEVRFYAHAVAHAVDHTG